MPVTTRNTRQLISQCPQLVPGRVASNTNQSCVIHTRKQVFSNFQCQHGSCTSKLACKNVILFLLVYHAAFQARSNSRLIVSCKIMHPQKTSPTTTGWPQQIKAQTIFRQRHKHGGALPSSATAFVLQCD
eukprot:1662294-Pleurochrysis_carterae.AAC.1